MAPRELDEDDVRVRPGKGSRPRTRTRPAHEDAQPARVLSVDRGRYRLSTADGTLVTAVRARELGRRAVVVGDRVAVVGDLSGSRTRSAASCASRSAPRCCAARPTTPTRWSARSSPTPTCSSS